jgi:hypothetical protein
MSWPETYKWQCGSKKYEKNKVITPVEINSSIVLNSNDSKVGEILYKELRRMPIRMINKIKKKDINNWMK